MTEIKINLFKGNSNRITISSGCKIAINKTEYQFEQKSFVPIEDWRELNDEESKIMICNNTNYINITLFKIPKFLVNQIKKLKIEECTKIEDIQIIENTQLFKNVTNDIIKFISIFSIPNNKIVPHNIYIGGSDLLCNTFNFLSKKYIGLHLDSWEKDSLKDRQKSRNRISINLGKDSRYLMFYSLSIITMAKKLKLNIHDENFDINEIYYLYAQKYPNTPIYRIEIKPYEAYIAPTEYVIHDGSTLGSTNPDINIVFRGKFIYQIRKVLLFKIKSFFDYFF